MKFRRQYLEEDFPGKFKRICTIKNLFSIKYSLFIEFKTSGFCNIFVFLNPFLQFPYFDYEYSIKDTIACKLHVPFHFGIFSSELFKSSERNLCSAHDAQTTKSFYNLKMFWNIILSLSKVLIYCNTDLLSH